jgi:hypothetical protein
MFTIPEGAPDDLRGLAIAQLRKKRDLQSHLIAFVTINLVLVAIWYVTNPDALFWPIFPILGWGIGVVLHIWDVYAPGPTEARVEREMRRLAARRRPAGS